jgi:hypothetical protein
LPPLFTHKFWGYINRRIHVMVLLEFARICGLIKLINKLCQSMPFLADSDSEEEGSERFFDATDQSSSALAGDHSRRSTSAVPSILARGNQSSPARAISIAYGPCCPLCDIEHHVNRAECSQSILALSIIAAFFNSSAIAGLSTDIDAYRDYFGRTVKRIRADTSSGVSVWMVVMSATYLRLIPGYRLVLDHLMIVVQQRGDGCTWTCWGYRTLDMMIQGVSSGEVLVGVASIDKEPVIEWLQQISPDIRP